MSSAALLEKLCAAGVRLTCAGKFLHYQTASGVSVTPYVEEIRQHKPGLLRELLQREIQAALDVGPARFDRQHYDDLWRQWSALPDPEAQPAALVPQLDAGWAWLATHPNHPEHEPFLERWLARLHAYERIDRNGGVRQ